MIRLSRLVIGFVVLVIVGALFVDGYGAAYQLYASHVADAHLGCNDVSLRGIGLTRGSGSFVVSDASGTDRNNVLTPTTDFNTGLPQWSSQWTYNISKGGGQSIGSISAHQLTNAAASAGFHRTKDGYHFQVAIGSAANDIRTFWLTCNSTTALTAPSPSPTSSSVLKPATSASASPSTTTPKTGSSPTSTAAMAGMTPIPTATSTPASASAPPNLGPPVGGLFWTDQGNAPTILGSPYTIQLHKGLDLVGGSELTIVICHGANNPAGSTCRTGLGNGDYAKAQQETLPIIEQRVNGLGVAEATVEPQGEDKIIVALPGVSLDEAIKTIGTTAKLHFATAVPGNADPSDPKFIADQENLYDVNQLTDAAFYPQGYHWKIDDKLQARNVTNASAAYDQNNNPSVDITFDSAGGDEWSKVTTAANAFYNASAGQQDPRSRVAIFLDNQVLTAPTVQSPSSNNTQITGGFTTDSATALANAINAGALPADISTIASTSVSATLGQQTVKQSLIAGAIGLLIVVLFMVGYYRFPGILASVALGCYALITLAVFKLIPITITLPGLAGFVLSVGMAVDANVLIFERTRDELRHGKPVSLAVETGFRRAFPAIRDSNVSTMITCAILFFFGSGVVKGFALTLFWGVLVSFLSAILITQSLFAIVLRYHFGRRPALYTEIHEEYATSPPKGRFDIVKSRNAFFAVSLAIIIPGILAILFWGFRLGLDFSGGNRLDAHLKTPATQSQVAATVNAIASDLRPQVLAESDNHFSIQTLPAPIVRVQEISSTLEKTYGLVTDPSTNKPDIQVDTVGPTIAADLVRTALILVLLSSLFIAAYLALVFRGQRQLSSRRFGVCTFLKLLHDVFVLVGIWAVMGRFSVLGEVNTLFIVAVLTSVAFSIHDTIVVFDRVRENLRFGPRLTFDQVINLSTVQTMTRSINTALTVVFVLLSLLLFGGESIRGFVLALLIGIVTGTYSSIFNASTLLVAWKSWDASKPDQGPSSPGRRRYNAA